MSTSVPSKVPSIRVLRGSRLSAVVIALLLMLPMIGGMSNTLAAPRSGESLDASALQSTASCNQRVEAGKARGDFVVSVGELNLRTGPSLKCDILTKLPFGTEVTIVGEESSADGYEWVPVQTAAGSGFVYTGSLRPASAIGQPTHIPVLMYHDIGDPPNRYRVAPWQLHEQFSWLRDNGYVAVTPSDLVRFLDEDVPLPPRPVMLTIDDGWASSRIFTEIARSYGFAGTYMLPNFAEISPEEIYQLAREGEVCGHTVSHQFLADLSRDAQWYEVAENKRWLEEITGKPVICMSYPFGSFSDVTTQVVIDSGYRIAFHAWWGPAPLDGTLDRWHVERIEVSGEYSLDTFIDIIGGVPS
jgi:peptidoglycan/xylan/chitin deacetylase (PgdA/CDA1 family)